MIDIELRCGWRITGTTSRPKGLRVMDADGNVVPGIQSVEIRADPTGYPEIRLGVRVALEEADNGGPGIA